MGEILSKAQADGIRSNVAAFDTAVYNTTNAATKVINSFSNQEVVESFFASGNYGEKEKELMEKILKGITEYNDIISGDSGLIKQTLNYLDTHTELVTTGSGGAGSSGTGSTSGGSDTNSTYGAVGAGHSF